MYLSGEIEISHPDNIVEYDLWFSSSLDFDKDFLIDLGNFFHELRKDTFFSPRIMTYSCPECTKEEKELNCLSNGEYCLYAPKHNWS